MPGRKMIFLQQQPCGDLQEIYKPYCMWVPTTLLWGGSSQQSQCRGGEKAQLTNSMALCSHLMSVVPGAN